MPERQGEAIAETRPATCIDRRAKSFAKSLSAKNSFAENGPTTNLGEPQPGDHLHSHGRNTHSTATAMEWRPAPLAPTLLPEGGGLRIARID